MQAQSKIDQIWVLRVITDSSRYRLEMLSSSTYQDLLAEISKRTGASIESLELYTPNQRKLNIHPSRRLKDVVYLSHGAIIHLRIPNISKNSASNPTKDFLSTNSKISGNSSLSPPKTLCSHPTNVMCLRCLSSSKDNQINEQKPTVSKSKEKQQLPCTHSPKAKCLQCIGRDVRSQEKVRQVKEMMSPIKENPEQTKPCRHRAGTVCRLCQRKPQKIKNMILLKQQENNQKKSALNITKQEKSYSPNCNHGIGGKCFNCFKIDQKELKKQAKIQCRHSSEGKCMHCIGSQQKPAHLSFDEYLSLKKLNCTHSAQDQCMNCLPPRNIRLKLQKNCKNHLPYPSGLCTSCMPQSLTIKTQEYRHVDYVQFMNQRQIQDFIKHWQSNRKNNQMRIGFLYGYYAQDPFYQNGIRAVVETVYQPHQYCTPNEFWILDSQERRQNVEIVTESLGLEKVGIILASANPTQTPLTEAQVRIIAAMQQKLSVKHSTGYKLSNFVTVIVREGRDKAKGIEPEVFMISDQGQALQAANIFVSNKQSSVKMKLKQQTPSGELLPDIYLGGKKASQIEIQFLLVKIGSGVGKSTKFAILKSNLFPPSSRGPVKIEQLKQYIKLTKGQPTVTRFGDLNLLIFAAEAIDLMTAMEMGKLVSEEKEAEESLCILLDRYLQKLIS